MSNHVGYEIGGNLLEAGFAAGSGALAAMAIASPVGPAGGALGATVGWLVGKPVQYITNKIFNADSPTATSISRLAQFAANFFANAAIFMFSAGWLGVPISFSASCVLAGVTVAMQMALVFAISTIATIWLKTSEV